MKLWLLMFAIQERKRDEGTDLALPVKAALPLLTSSNVNARKSVSQRRHNDNA